MRKTTEVFLTLFLICIAGCTDKTEPATKKNFKFVTATQERANYIRAARVQKKNWTPAKTAAFDFRRPPKTGYAEFYSAKPESLSAIQTCTFSEPEIDGLQQAISSAELNEVERLLSEKAPGGRTPKFECAFALTRTKNGALKTRTLRVKYDPYHLYRDNKPLYQQSKEEDWTSNAEVYGEVIATRLLAALGFYSDKIYTFDKIVCRDCPIEPWTYTRAYFNLLDTKDSLIGFTRPELFNDHTGLSFANPEIMRRADLVVSPAIVEIKMGGARIRDTSGQAGWTWTELLELLPVDEHAAKEEAMKRGALALLAAFLNHMDNKKEQQRIVCKQKSIVENQDGVVSCKQPILMIQDAGANLGNGWAPLQGDFRLNKLDLKKWRALSVWQERSRCLLNVNDRPKLSFTSIGFNEKGFKDQGFTNIRVTDSARAYLASFMEKLNFSQLVDLFIEARIEQWPNDASSAESWANAFLFKLQRDILNTRCG